MACDSTCFCSTEGDSRGKLSGKRTGIGQHSEKLVAHLLVGGITEEAILSAEGRIFQVTKRRRTL